MAKILIYCLDTVGNSMAGPAIRCWEFATILSSKHEVTLYVPNTPNITTDMFTLLSYEKVNLTKQFATFDVIITQKVTPPMAYIAKRAGTRIILDAYDPIPLEGLEIYKERTLKVARSYNKLLLDEQERSFALADAVICASEKQRDLWLGQLMAMGKIHPENYREDSSLRSLIDVVPFGLQSALPKRSGKDGLKKHFGLKESDKVVLWGGGIWNWFDPLTLIKAIGMLSTHRSDIKLVFMGLKHPNEGIKEMEMSVKAVKLAKDMGLENKSVFFNYGWVPYNERANYFLDATVGVSTHFDHLETRFSFRTRMLDYLWSSLPIVATEGDSFAELIGAQNLGRVVPYENAEALAQAIEILVDDKTEVTQIKANIEAIKTGFYWEKVVTPIFTMIDKLEKSPRRQLSTKEIQHIFRGYVNSLQAIRQEKGTLPVLTNVAMKAYKIATRKF